MKIDEKRRSFLFGSLALVAGCAGVPTYRVAEDPGFGPVRVPLSAIKEQGFTVVESSGQEHPILVQMVGGEVTAVAMTCTHRGCALRARRNLLTCPCHGSEFQFDGTLLTGPAEVALTRLPVSREESWIEVGRS